MGTIMSDFFGYRYDDSVPAFVTLSEKLSAHRATRKMYDTAALEARMADAGYTPGANEIGEDDDWAENHYPGMIEPPEPVYAAATVTVLGDGGQVIAFEIEGALPDGATAGTLTVTGVAFGGTAVEGLAPVTINEGDTREAIAAALAAMLQGLQDAGATYTLQAVAGGPDVTLIEAGGATFDSGVAAAIT